MSRLNSVIVLILCITVGAACIASAQAEVGKVFSLHEENGNIILPVNASYVESGAQYYYDNVTGLQIHVWYIPMFTTGNGTTNLYVSAQNCNLTVNSFKQTTTPMETEYTFNVSSSVDCAVTGDGIAHINVNSFDGSNLAVYINGVSRQAGDGWNLTDGYIALQGPANVAMFSSETEFWPPRNPPTGPPLNEFTYMFAVLVTVVVCVLAVAVYLHSRHKRPLNQQIPAQKFCFLGL